jgi:hypothetical protein
LSKRANIEVTEEAAKRITPLRASAQLRVHLRFASWLWALMRQVLSRNRIDFSARYAENDREVLWR